MKVPLNTNDFSSALLQAQASKAKVIGLANAGTDAINAIKQSSEFGIIRGGQRLAGLLVFITDVQALGLQIRAGAGDHQLVLLGSQRQDPRVDQALYGGEQRPGSDYGPCRRLSAALHYLAKR